MDPSGGAWRAGSQLVPKASSEGVLPYVSETSSSHQRPSHPHSVHSAMESFEASSSCGHAQTLSHLPTRPQKMMKSDSQDSVLGQRTARRAERVWSSPAASESESFGRGALPLVPLSPGLPPGSAPNGFRQSFINSVRGRPSEVARASVGSKSGDWMSETPSHGVVKMRSRGGSDVDQVTLGRLRSRIQGLGSIKSQVPFAVGQEGSSNTANAQFSRAATDNFVFEVLPLWQQVTAPVKNTTTARMRRISAGDALPELPEARRTVDWSTLATCCVLHEGISPASKKRMVWDVLTALFVLWDLVTIPTQFLELPSSAFDTVMTWLVALFWTFDIFATLSTGVVLADGTIVLALPYIAASYARSWMAPDVCLSMSAWGDIFVGAMNGVRFLPFFRVVRMLRLARLARLQAVLNSLTDTNSVMLNLIFSFVKSISAIILLVHVIACVWVGIGRIDEEAWVLSKGFLNAGSSTQYSIAFHWALTQFTGAFADPWGEQTKAERVFGTFALFFGFLMASCFVSNITSLMTQISFVANHQSSHLKALTRYLQAHSVSKRLSERLQRNVQHALRVQAGGTPEHEIEVLKLVSEPLMKELHFELYAPVLKVHPLFRWMADEDPSSLRSICHTAITEIIVFEADVIFCPGEVSSSPCMLFVLSGVQQYIQSADDSDILDLDGTMPGTEVRPGEWLCEHFLWTKWIYQGMLLAKTQSRFLAVTARRFQDILCNTKSKLPTYATQFVAALNSDMESTSDLGSSVDSEGMVSKLCGGGVRRPSFLRQRRTAITSIAMPPSSEHTTSVVPM